MSASPAEQLVADVLQRVAAWTPHLAANPSYRAFLLGLPLGRLRRIHADTLRLLPDSPRIVHLLPDRHGRVPQWRGASTAA